MSNRNVPELRLDGFEGEWDVVQLGGFSSKVNEKNLTLTIAETFTNSAEHGVVSQIEFFKHQVSNDENLGGYYVVGPNDYIYNPRISARAPVGPVNRNKLGRPGVVSPLYTVFRVLSVDHQYLDAFFMSSRWHSFMKQNGDSGARGDRLSINQEIFFQLPVAKPSYKEQQAIGVVFTNLDAAIDQHTNKHRVLQRTKTALMQKMFPQDGQTEPELRLDGFEGEWLADPIKRIAPLQRGFDLPHAQIRGGSVPVVMSNGVQYRHDTAQAKGPGVVTGRSGTIGKVQYIYEDYWPHNTTLWVTDFHRNNPKFICYLFETIDLKRFASGSGVPTLNRNDVHDHVSAVPPTLEEQQAIGAVFTKLDSLISAEAQLIEKLKQTKTALLQKMFV